MAITIIFAPPRTGKTCFMTHIARETCFDRNRNRSMQQDILLKQQNGFNSLKTIPQHCITEAQKYLNSRMSMYFPEWQSRWYEQHGHFDLDIYLDTQRPMLIDVNIRELAQFIEIVKLDLKYDDYGKVKSLTWTIRKIDNSSLFDRYMASGKKDKECYTEETVTANYNVFECYDSQNCKPKI